MSEAPSERPIEAPVIDEPGQAAPLADPHAPGDSRPVREPDTPEEPGTG